MSAASRRLKATGDEPLEVVNSGAEDWIEDDPAASTCRICGIAMTERTSADTTSARRTLRIGATTPKERAVSTSAEPHAAYRDYEVEVVLTVTAPDRLEAEAAVRRSGLSSGQLVGEALIDMVTVYGPEDE